LSLDDQLNTSEDIFLGSRRVSFPANNFVGTPGGLADGAGYTRKASLTTSNTLAGDFFLFVVADGSNDVFELDNANNVGFDATPITIQQNHADFVVSSITGDATAEANGSLNIQWTITNQGTGSNIKTSWVDTIYASVNDIPFDADDRQIAVVSRAGRIEPGESLDRSIAVSVPLDISGTYNFFIQSDKNFNVFETDDANNTSALLPVNIIRKTADLMVTPTLLQAEIGRVRVAWDVANNGNGETNTTYWRDAIYASTNDVFGDDDDVEIGSVYHSGRLMPASGYSVSTVFDIPLSLSGPLHFFVATDVNQQVDEDDMEANNAAIAGQLDVDTLRSSPDLIVHSVDAPNEVFADQIFDVIWVGRNVGDPFVLNTNPLAPEYRQGRWTDRVYLSKDQIFDPSSDIYLGQTNVFASQLMDVDDAVEGQFQEYTRTLAVRMPDGLTGPFYVFVSTDRSNQVIENALDPAGETNNANYDLEPIVSSLVPPADLVLGTITVPANTQLGDLFTLSYTLENMGANDATGYWHDRFFLSVDDQLSPDDVRIGLRTHRPFGIFADPSIPAGGDLTLDFTNRMPGVTPGDYHLIIRTDAFNLLPESDETNNIGASLDTFEVQVPQIVLTNGTGLAEIESFVFNGQTRSFFYQIDTPEGQTLEFDTEWLLTEVLNPDFNSTVGVGSFNSEFIPAPRNALTSLYVAFDRVPTPFDHDFTQEQLLRSFSTLGLSTSLILPGTQAGSYFIRVDIRDAHPRFSIFNNQITILGSNEHFNLHVTELPFTVTEIDPGVVGNTGPATLEVTASNFNFCSGVHLLQNGQVILESTDLQLLNNTRALVTFDFDGLTPGDYELRILDYNGEFDSQTITVVDGIGPVVGSTIQGPSRLRRNREYLFYANYGNSGDADGVAPLILIENLDQNPFGLTRDGQTVQPTLQALGISLTGDAGVLRPGQLGSVPVFASTVATFANSSPGSYLLNTITADDARPLDFNAIEAQVRPDGIADDVWNDIRPRLMDRLGPTWGSYVKALADTATKLSKIDLRTRDVSIIFEQLYRDVVNPFPQSITGHVVAEEGCGVIPDPVVRAMDANGSTAGVATVTELGEFIFFDLNVGTYTIIVDAEGFARTLVPDVVLGSDPIDLKIHMLTESVVNATVVLGPNGLANGEILFSAQRQDAPTDPEALFTS